MPRLWPVQRLRIVWRFGNSHATVLHFCTSAPTSLIRRPAGRTHVEALSDEAGAQVTVQAPGYEQMLSGQKWEELPL